MAIVELFFRAIGLRPDNGKHVNRIKIHCLLLSCGEFVAVKNELLELTLFFL